MCMLWSQSAFPSEKPLTALNVKMPARDIVMGIDTQFSNMLICELI